ncbi:hypothetical protein NDU88_007370 [Pleurodeles waltl]|uniref:Uncharacterized protein n=1 Tax=Pleurodeles waltl TaxID=8319 RepID=A0AAV7RS91_PLEWA|nr:hypothetical protein NDU88_007370 [Pleurodeles waltl]
MQSKLTYGTWPGPQESGLEGQTSLEPKEQMQATAEILAAIQRSRIVLYTKMDMMAIDINHLRLGLHQVAKRTTGMEEDVTILKKEIKELQATVGLKCSVKQMEEYVDNAEGSLRRNNLCFIRFPERAEGPLVELFHTQG